MTRRDRCVPCVASEFQLTQLWLDDLRADTRPADPSPEEWKARASLTALPGRLPAGSITAAPTGELDRLLCYACLTTLNGRKDGSLPPFVDAGVHERREGATKISRGEMREAIADFLLDEAGGEEA